MKTRWPGHVMPPRTSSEQDWLSDPMVVATGESSKQARSDWMQLAPPENWLLRDLDRIQLAALLRMLETDRSYRAAKMTATAAAAATRSEQPFRSGG